jgi:hypothetical protein
VKILHDQKVTGRAAKFRLEFQLMKNQYSACTFRVAIEAGERPLMIEEFCRVGDGVSTRLRTFSNSSPNATASKAMVKR